MSANLRPAHHAKPLYTTEQRQRRDGSAWTLVQGVLAPVQFAVFLVSLTLVIHYLLTDEGQYEATFSVVIKTLTLYTIMITGSIWERVVFGRYLFADAFFWEDVFSMLVLALHTAYLASLALHWLDSRGLMLLALAAYGAYVINAAQFVLKLRAARLGVTKAPLHPRKRGWGEGFSAKPRQRAEIPSSSASRHLLPQGEKGLGQWEGAP